MSKRGWNEMKNINAVLSGFMIFILSSIVLAQEAECPEGYVCTKSGNDSTITTEGDMNTKITQPPPSAIAPHFNSGSNSDLCTIGVSVAVQTQILGISGGGTFTEENCQRLKNAKVLYDMGMKVAAVSVMCQDKNVFDAMMQAGTPCPYDGKIGEEAKIGWESHVEQSENELEAMESIDVEKKAPSIGFGILALLLLL